MVWCSVVPPLLSAYLCFKLGECDDLTHKGCGVVCFRRVLSEMLHRRIKVRVDADPKGVSRSSLDEALADAALSLEDCIAS